MASITAGDTKFSDAISSILFLCLPSSSPIAAFTSGSTTANFSKFMITPSKSNNLHWVFGTLAADQGRTCPCRGEYSLADLAFCQTHRYGNFL